MVCTISNGSATNCSRENGTRFPLALSGRLIDHGNGKISLLALKADCLPSPFNNVERLGGAQRLKVKHGQVDSGGIVRRNAK